MSILLLVIVVAIFAFIPAVSLTVAICGWDGLSPENFFIIRTCSVTDPPAEVFFGFLTIGGILGATVVLLYCFWRRFSR